MTINCVTGKMLSLESMELYPCKLKKHSLLEIERIAESLMKDGYLFPISIGRVGEHNYIIDGEATYLALQSIKQLGEEIPELPICYIRCTEESIKKMILISTSTNHMVTEVSLKSFVDGTDIDLHNFGFNNGDLIEFSAPVDLTFYKETTGGKLTKDGVVLKAEDFEGLLA